MTRLRDESTPFGRKMWQEVDAAAARAPKWYREKKKITDSKLKVGARVKVYWDNHLDENLEGTVEHVPVAIGDLLHVRSNSGSLHCINTQCVTFQSVVVMPEEQDDDA